MNFKLAFIDFIASHHTRLDSQYATADDDAYEYYANWFRHLYDIADMTDDVTLNHTTRRAILDDIVQESRKFWHTLSYHDRLTATNLPPWIQINT